MSATPDSSRQLISELAGDTDMIELVECFVRELPARAASIEQCLDRGDYEQLARFAHRLKGAAGGYGFPTITEKAALVEQQAKDRGSLSELAGLVRELGEMCRSARATPCHA